MKRLQFQNRAMRWLLIFAIPFAALADNDNFSNRNPITGSFASVSATNTNATHEAGEPNHANVVSVKSLWWSWTAPNTGRAVIDTAGSDFDTVLAVYTGTALNSLNLMASNDDDPAGGTTSRVSFSTTANTTYQIAVSGYGDSDGNITLNIASAATGNFALGTPQKSSAGPFNFKFFGNTTGTYGVESSSDFTVWNSLLTTNGMDVPLLITDGNAGSTSHQFYRVKSPAQQATVTVNTYYENTDFAADPGVIIFANGKQVGVTGSGGKATVNIDPGTVTLRAVEPGICAGTQNLTLAPGASVSANLVMESEDLPESTIFVIDQVTNGVLAADFTELTGKFVDATNGTVHLVSLDSLTAQALTDTDPTDVIDYVAVLEDGTLETIDVEGLHSIIDYLSKGPIVITAQATDSGGLIHLSSITIRLTSYSLDGNLGAPPSNSGLPLENHVIKATLAGTSIYFKTISDADGNFSFPALPAGDYTLECYVTSNNQVYSGIATLGLSSDSSIQLNLLGATDVLDNNASLSLSGVHPATEPTAERLLLDQKAKRAQSRTLAGITKATQDNSVSVSVTAGAQDATISQTATLNVPAGTKTIQLSYNVSTIEYPYYVLSQSIFNDLWGIRVVANNGASIFSIFRNVNSQLYTEPVWQSDGSTGLIVQNFDVSAYTAHDTSFVLYAETKDIGDGILPTTVNATLSAESQFVISKITREPPPGANNSDGSYFSIPRQGAQNTDQRYFMLTLSGRPAGSTLKNVRVDLLPDSSDSAFGTILNTGPGSAVQEIDSNTLRIRVTNGPENPSSIGSVPPPTHRIRYQFTVTVTSIDSGDVSTPAKKSGIQHALWSMPDGFSRFGDRDSGGDDWCAMGTYQWLSDYSDQVTSINDISGEHSRNLGHATHFMGTDIDMYHFTNLLNGGENGTLNYKALANLTVQALNGSAEAKATVTSWFQTARTRLDQLTDNYSVSRVYTSQGAGGVTLPVGWAESLLRDGILEDNQGRTLDLGIGTWDNSYVSCNQIHNNHVHITLNPARIGAGP